MITSMDRRHCLNLEYFNRTSKEIFLNERGLDEKVVEYKSLHET